MRNNDTRLWFMWQVQFHQETGSGSSHRQYDTVSDTMTCTARNMQEKNLLINSIIIGTKCMHYNVTNNSKQLHGQ